MVSEACHAVGDGYTCEADAITESTVSDTCYAIRDCVCGFRFTFGISYQLGFFLIKQAPVFIGIIPIGVRDINACETVAIVTSIVSDACYAVRDCYACEAVAITESFLSDTCYAVGDYNILFISSILSQYAVFN